MIGLLLWLGAAAADAPRIAVSPGADLKSFTIATFPYEHSLMPEDPWAQGILDGRARLHLEMGPRVQLTAHHAITLTTGEPTSGSMGGLAGVGGGAPEAVELSWEGVDADAMTLRGRTDRLVAEIRMGPVDVSLGRQAISLGQGMLFQPMDLVNPFHPATIDSEYKPGVDALRVDAYAGMAGRLTLVAAYAGDWSLEGMVLAAYGQGTIGVTDLSVFIGEVHEDEVVGLGTVSSIGPVGIIGEATLTFPSDCDEVTSDPFVRATVGASGRPTEKLYLVAEIYHQSLGAESPDDYLDMAASERFSRGELMFMGRSYGGLMASYELRPRVGLSVFGLVNLGDGSALVAPGLSFSVAEDVDLVAGGFLGLGERPDDVDLAQIFAGDMGLNSEFGLLPHTAYLQMKSWF